MKDKIVLISLICILCFCSCGKKQKAEDKELTILKWVYEDDHVCKISAEQQEYFNKLLKDKGYAVSVDFIGIPTDDYIATVDKMVKDEECPDILFTGCGSGKDAVDGSARVLEYDWLDDLTEYLNSEEGEKLRNSVPEKVYKSCSINGRYYGLSSFLPLYSNFTLFINEDILENNNIEIEDGFKYDIKEIKKLLEKVGKIEDCTMLIPFDGSLSDNVSGFEKLCNYKGDYCLLLGAEADSSEGIINLLENKRIQDYIITLTELRKNGYLEQGRDFFICVSNNDISTDVINSKIEQLTQKYGNKKIKVVQSDAYYMWTVRNGITGICKNSHNKEKSLEVLTAVMTDQNLSDALLYKTQDGKMDIKDKKIEPHSTYWYRALQFGNRFISTECVQEPDNKKEYMTDFYNSMPETALFGVYLDLSEYNETISKINELYTDYRELFEGKSENPEKEIEELNKKLYEAGIKELIDEANRQLKSPVSETKNESGEKEICYIDYDSSLNGCLLFSTGDKLSFTDLKEGGKGYVCNIPGCFHDGKNKECPAVKYAGAFYPFEYGEKIYFLFKTQGAEFLNDTGTNYKLIEMNKDGSDYKEIYSFGENEAPCIGGKSALRIEDKMYFSMLYLKREIDENGYDNIRESRALIYEFDITNRKVAQIYKSEKSYSEAIPDLWNGGDKLIVSLEYQKNSLEDSGYTNEEWMNIIMNSANMSAEEWKTVYEKIGLTYAVSIIDKKDYSAETTEPSWKIMGVWDDKLIVQDDDELNKTHDLKFEAYDFRTKTYTDVPSPFEDYRVEPFSGGVILKNNEKNEYSVLKDGNYEPGPVRTKEKEFAIFKESKDYFYLAWFGQDEGPFDNYELVEKKTILE